MEFIESIFVQYNTIENLVFHQNRIQKARKFAGFLAKSWVDDLENILYGFLKDFSKNTSVLRNINLSENQVYKLRLLYADDINSYEIVPYFPKNIQKLKLVQINDYTYTHKYTDRGKLNNFLAQKQDADEVILVKHNRLTDTSYSNIIWSKDLSIWHTTPFPLLEGTFRAKLLAENRLVLTDITLQNYQDFPYFKLINALLQDNSPILNCEKISPLIPKEGINTT